jgi:hypothetical protein
MTIAELASQLGISTRAIEKNIKSSRMGTLLCPRGNAMSNQPRGLTMKLFAHPTKFCNVSISGLRFVPQFCNDNQLADTKSGFRHAAVRTSLGQV